MKKAKYPTGKMNFIGESDPILFKFMKTCCETIINFYKNKINDNLTLEYILLLQKVQLMKKLKQFEADIVMVKTHIKKGTNLLTRIFGDGKIITSNNPMEFNGGWTH